MTANRSTAFSVVTSTSFATEFVNVPGIYRKNKGKTQGQTVFMGHVGTSKLFNKCWDTPSANDVWRSNTQQHALCMQHARNHEKEWMETRQRVPTLSDQCIFKITIPVILLSTFTLSTFTINSEWFTKESFKLNCEPVKEIHRKESTVRMIHYGFWITLYKPNIHPVSLDF